MAGEFIGPLSTLIGAGAGAAFGGPAGASMGAKIGSAAGGLGTMFSGARAKKKSESLRPGLVDPNQISRLEEAKRKLRQMESGTDASTQAALRESRGLTESTKSDLSKVTGGNIAATTDALLKAQRVGGANARKIMGDAGNRASGFQSIVERMANRVEDRKREIQQDMSSQAAAESAEAFQTGSQNLVSGAISAIPVVNQSAPLSFGQKKGVATQASNNQIVTATGATKSAIPGLATPTFAENVQSQVDFEIGK